MYPVIFDLPQWVPFLGGESITSFGVFMLFSFLTAGYVLRAEMRRVGQDPEVAWDLVFMAVIGGIVGAKAYYVLLNFPRLIEDPAGLIFARGGLVWYGGFLLALALVVWEIRRQKLPLAATADLHAPALAIAYGVGRIGCFLVGDDWGLPTDSPLGMRFPDGTPPTTVTAIEQQFGVTVDPALIEQYGQIVPVHPTQLYEVVATTLVFLFLWRIRRHGHRPGWLFMLWLGLAGLQRFLVEFLRAKDDRFLGPLTVAQVISLAILAVGVYGVVKLRDRSEREEPAAEPA